MSDHRAPQRASLIGRPSRRLLAVLTVLLVVAGTTWFTGASFTSGTNTPFSIGAAKDYYPPKVTVTSPGATVAGTVAISAPATDSGSGVAQVVVQYAAATSTSWTTICTDTTSPYSCTWDTLAVLDGDYQLRAIATDNVGTTATSAVVTTRVANPAAVTLTTVADVVRGGVVLRATVTGAGTRATTTTFQYRLTGTTDAWTTACAGGTTTSPSCTWATGTLADTYDIRASTVVGSGGAALTVTHDQNGVIVDNAAPIGVTVDAPSPMSGTVQVTGLAVDEDSGIARVELSYRVALLGSWTTLCTVSTEPYRCSLNTTTLANGSYELRAIATDVAGNSTTATATRTVNNLSPTISITAPLAGDRVTGTRTITTDFSANGNTVNGVLFEARPTGTTAWTSLCSDNAAPYTCDWATASLASGSWDLRATMTYSGAVANQTVPSPVVAVTVDNSPVRATDVQATNGGVAGKADAGDTLVFTFSGSVAPGSIVTGWNGTGSAALSAVFRDKASGTSTTRDKVELGNLGTVTFGQDLVRKRRSVTLGASVTMTTAANGSSTTVIVTLQGSTSTDLLTSTTAAAMTWTPTAAIRSTSNVAGSTATATETGTADRDL